MRPLVVLLIATSLLATPGAGLIAVSVLMNPAARASVTCTAAPISSAGHVSGGLSVTTSDGITLTLSRRQVSHAATIVSVGVRTEGVGHDGVQVALMAALTESNLQMLANRSAYLESTNYANDGDGGDHDSLGLFQMRPSAGWGTVAELMNATYQARAFFGGGNGPNHGSPRGLLDIPGWRTLPKGAAAQAVEVSAYPDRYARYEPVAAKILHALGGAAANHARTVEGLDNSVAACPEGGVVDQSLAGDPARMVDDPTSGGRITARTAYVLARIRNRFPTTAWTCWSPRPGTTSEHPLGRACDGTMGNPIGVPAAGSSLNLGWQVTNWLKTNATVLGIEYLIWQGRIWSRARIVEGWRPYHGGGMHNPTSVTGGHYDHLHFTAT